MVVQAYYAIHVTSEDHIGVDDHAKYSVLIIRTSSILLILRFVTVLTGN
jgi:hypothetical protein